ncbi:MAG: hypothetical protein WCH31_08615 [Actinomycetes bacterium]
MKLTLLALVACAALGAGSASATGSPTGTTRYSAEALLAADVPWATVQTVAGASFWPQMPGFDTRVYQASPQPLATVVQNYRDIDGKTSIQTALYSFGNERNSLAFIQSEAIVGPPIDQVSPAIGDQHFYFVTTLANGSPSTRFYFTQGSVGVFLEVEGARWSKSRITELAAPIAANVKALIAGHLHAPTLPADEISHLPRSSDAPGPLLGTAAVRAEAWATLVHKGSPRTIRDQLVRGGNTTFAFRRYLRQGSSTDVIEVSLFHFGSAETARAWFAPFEAAIQKHPSTILATGSTGSSSAFRFDLENYELRFVAGTYVADVFCYAPYVSTVSPTCATAARTLAQQWYAELPK